SRKLDRILLRVAGKEILDPGAEDGVDAFPVAGLDGGNERLHRVLGRTEAPLLARRSGGVRAELRRRATGEKGEHGDQKEGVHGEWGCHGGGGLVASATIPAAGFRSRPRGGGALDRSLAA